MAALLGVLGSGLGAAATGIGFAAVNAFGNITADWDAAIDQDSEIVNNCVRASVDQLLYQLLKEPAWPGQQRPGQH